MNRILSFFALLSLASCKFHHQEYDKIIHNGLIYDGNGGKPYKADIGIRGDTIAFIGDLSKAKALKDIDARNVSTTAKRAKANLSSLGI